MGLQEEYKVLATEHFPSWQWTSLIEKWYMLKDSLEVRMLDSLVFIICLLFGYVQERFTLRDCKSVNSHWMVSGI